MRRCTATLVLCLLSACATPPALPPGFGRLAAEAPEDLPLRLQLDGDRVVGAAAPLGPGALPPAVRTMAEAVAPGGTLVYVAREWSARGEGFRVEKSYAEGPDQQFRSAMIAADGSVLERSHSVPIGTVPQPVLLAATTHSRSEVLRAEIVSGPAHEEAWRITVRDGGGRTFVCECRLDGSSGTVQRLLSARIALP